ncbi:MAG: sulfatase [bacterium]|nr:sulfatase [bacterium]
MSPVAILVGIALVGIAAWGWFRPRGPIVHEGRWSFERIGLRPSVPYASRDAKLVHALTPPDGLAPWNGFAAAPLAIVDVPIRTEEGTQDQKGVRVEGAEAKELRIPGPFEPGAFNRVVTLIRAHHDAETVNVVLRSGGEQLEASGWKEVHPSRQAEIFTFELPGARRLTEAEIDKVDEVVLQFQSGGGVTDVVSLSLMQRPAHDFLPAHAEDSEASTGGLVRVGDELRRAFGLSSEHPLTGTFVVGDTTELVFSYGHFQPLRMWSDRSVVTATIAGEDGSSWSDTFALEKKFPTRAEWHTASVDLTRFQGQRVTLTLELESRGEHEAFCVLGEPIQRRRGQNAPLVLLISSDTHRADHLGMTGKRVVQTPTLDALARRGVLFDNCYSSTNVTNPSHVALLTGVHPRDTRVVNNRTPLASQATTLAEEYRAAGYRTLAALSAHHLLDSSSGLGQGFDRMSAPNFGDRNANLTIDVLEEWLDDAAGEPTFVWLHLFDAHAPYGPPQPFDRKYYDKNKDPFEGDPPADMSERLFPEDLEGLNDLDYPYQQYRAEVDYLDAQLARILDRPRALAGIVAFTADHGESFGHNGVYWDHAELYPSNVHIPLILAWPDAPAEQRTAHPVSQIDIGRTLLELSGIETEYPGRDLREALTEDAPDDARFLLAAHGFSSAVQSGKWLLMLHHRRHHQWAVKDERQAYQVELYDLVADPGCDNDLVEPEFETAKRLRASLIRWLENADPQGLATSTELSAEAAESLAALGYTSAPDDTAGAWWDPDPKKDKHGWLSRFED